MEQQKKDGKRLQLERASETMLRNLILQEKVTNSPPKSQVPLQTHFVCPTQSLKKKKIQKSTEPSGYTLSQSLIPWGLKLQPGY